MNQYPNDNPLDALVIAIRFLIGFLAGYGLACWGCPAKGAEVEPAKRYTSPATAAATAVADVGQLQAADRCVIRYLWNSDGDPLTPKLVSFALNAVVSKASTIRRPAVVADGLLVRVDLLAYAPNDDDLIALIDLWESLAEKEPYFTITRKVAVPLSKLRVGDLIRVRFSDGRWRSCLFQRLNGSQVYFTWRGKLYQQHEKFVDVLATVMAPWLGDASPLLSGATQSQCPIVRADWWLVQVLTTLRGGRYYDFARIRQSNGEQTARELFLEEVGADQQLVDQLDSLQKIALKRSEVTGKPRQVFFFYGVGNRPGDAIPLVTITEDLTDEDVQAEQDPIRNLQNFKGKGSEAIRLNKRGFQDYALFDGDGDRVDVVPQNIATDRHVPDPHTKNLQPGISCIFCHGMVEGERGYKPAPNHIQLMVRGRGNIFDDLSEPKKTGNEVLDELASEFGGSLDKPFFRARMDFSDAVFRATGGLSVAELANGLYAAIYGYLYDPVNATLACQDLGVDPPAEKAIETFSALIGEHVAGPDWIIPEDPTFAAILTPTLFANRYEWELVYADAAIRQQETLRAQLQERIEQLPKLPKKEKKEGREP